MNAAPHDLKLVQDMALRAGDVSARAVTEGSGRQTFWQNYEQISEEAKTLEVVRPLVPSTIIKHKKAEEALKAFVIQWAQREAHQEMTNISSLNRYLAAQPPQPLPIAFWKLYVRYLTFRVKAHPEYKLVSRVSLKHAVYSALSAFERLTATTLPPAIRRTCLDLAATIVLTVAPLSRSKPIATFTDLTSVVKFGVFGWDQHPTALSSFCCFRERLQVTTFMVLILFTAARPGEICVTPAQTGSSGRTSPSTSMPTSTTPPRPPPSAYIAT